jgi:hypothetical protein
MVSSAVSAVRTMPSSREVGAVVPGAGAVVAVMRFS